jgi:proteasome beta subunit
MSTGSGSPVAYGVLESQCRDGMTVKEGVITAAQAVFAAIKRNAFTGDSIRVVVIDKSGYRGVTDEERQSIESAGVTLPLFHGNEL